MRGVDNRVEHPDGQRIQRESGKVERDDWAELRHRAQRILREIVRQLIERRKIADVQHRAPERALAAVAIDPCDRIAVLRVSPFESLDRGVDITGANQLAIEIRALDPPHSQLEFENHAGQTHPADRRPEQLGVFLPRASQHLARSDHQVEPCHMRSQRRIAMVILAMNIGRDRSAKRDEAGARRDRREKAARQEYIDQLGDSNASLAAQKPGRCIERQHPVEPGELNHAILIVKRRIAISPPRPARNQRRSIRGNDRLQLSNLVRPINIALEKRIPPPSREQSMPRTRRRGPSSRHNEKTASTN